MPPLTNESHQSTIQKLLSLHPAQKYSYFYILLMIIVLLGIAVRMTHNAHATLLPMGVNVASQGISGRAELRAYYFGTSSACAVPLIQAILGVGGDESRLLALRVIQVLFGGFAGSRVLSYFVDGRDYEDPLYGADLTFLVEVVGKECNVE